MSMGSGSTGRLWRLPEGSANDWRNSASPIRRQMRSLEPRGSSLSGLVRPSNGLHGLQAGCKLVALGVVSGLLLA